MTQHVKVVGTAVSSKESTIFESKKVVGKGTIRTSAIQQQ
jgi:hypothetical protein